MGYRYIVLVGSLHGEFFLEWFLLLFVLTHLGIEGVLSCLFNAVFFFIICVIPHIVYLFTLLSPVIYSISSSHSFVAVVGDAHCPLDKPVPNVTYTLFIQYFMVVWVVFSLHSVMLCITHTSSHPVQIGVGSVNKLYKCGAMSYRSQESIQMPCTHTNITLSIVYIRQIIDCTIRICSNAVGITR